MKKKPRKRTRKPSPTPPRAVKAWVGIHPLGTPDVVIAHIGDKPSKILAAIHGDDGCKEIYIIPAAAVERCKRRIAKEEGRFNIGADRVLADLGLGATP